MAKSPFDPLDTTLRLPPPLTRTKSRSPSRSPDRKSKFLSHQLDPLLSDLSPEITLQVLSATDAVPIKIDSPHSVLAKSICDVSTADRAFGIRAAVAAQKLKEWHTEILSWAWSEGESAERENGFLPPKNCTDGVPTDSDRTDGLPEAGAYFGCLPASILKQYRNRIMEIKADMEALEVEDLKEHVLTVHIPSRSRPPSASSTTSTNSRLASYIRMSDFTAVITATILRALPILSKLNILLGTWHCRLLVLYKVPALLVGFKETKEAVNIAISRLRNGMLPHLDDRLFTREPFRVSWGKLQDMVSSLGRRLDGMLDILEGGQDSLPDAWIVEMESIESRFAKWAFAAERRAIENELRCLDQDKCRKNSLLNPPETISKDISKDVPKAALSVNIPQTPASQPKITVEDYAVVPSTSKAAPDGDTQADNQPSPIPSIDHVSGKRIEKSSKATDPIKPSTPTQEGHCGNAYVPEETYKDTDPIEPSTPTQERPCGNSYAPGQPSKDTDPIKPSTPTQERPCGNAYVPRKPSKDIELIKPSTPTQERPFGTAYAPEKASKDTELIKPSTPTQENPCGISYVLDKPSKDTERIKPLTPTQERPFKNAHVPENPDDVDAPTAKPHAASSSLIGDVEGKPRSTGAQKEYTVSDEVKQLPSPEATPSPAVPLTSLRKRPSKRQKLIPSEPQLVLSGSDAPSKQCDSTLVINPSSEPVSISNEFVADKETAQATRSPESLRHHSPAASSSGSVIHHTPDARNNPASQPQSGPPSSQNTPSLPPSRPFNGHMSLPLARYINDEFNPVYGPENISQSIDQTQISNASVESLEIPPKVKLQNSIFTRRGSLVPDTLPRHDLRKSASLLSITSSPLFKKNASPYEPSDYFSLSHLRHQASSEQLSPGKLPASPLSMDSSNAAHTSPESVKRSFKPKYLTHASSPQTPSTYTEDDSPAHVNPPPKPRFHTTLNTPARPSDDQMDDRINSILGTIPTKIRLKSALSEDPSDRSRTGSLRLPKNSKPSRSPSPTPSRPDTPTPSFTLTPAVGRSKRSHNYSHDEVRLYHLHRGGKAAPVKLFVRLVGEKGERVMVRVGGGWADLGEYLREYAIHHGRRTTSDGRFEVQGIPTTSSPNYPPRSSTPTNGRSTPIIPSRPGSALEARSGSSLAVRKTRRATGTGGDLPTLTAANIQRLSEEGSIPAIPSFLSSQRRPSVSSATSMSMASAVGDSSFNTTASQRSYSTVTGFTHHSTPLGLAGPKPRSKQHTISPESEAWVEDVMGQARRTSSTLRSQRSMTTMRSSSALRRLPSAALNEGSPTNNIAAEKIRNENKLRSVSDYGTVALNKRVFLRRLGKEQE